ncbi:MAG: hypothetical protein IJ456_10705, partial [Bacteroides sp.]|nr:hypothetical protein [Bacteroides sp.]
RLGVECGSIWLTQAQNEENHALFPAKEDFTAFISLMWLVKSSMFVRDFSPDLDDVINSNPQYPRTVFLVPRFRKHFLLIVKKESLPDDISLRILFRFSWKDAGQGLVSIERVCDDIPPILQGLEALSGNNGQTIYERMFKGKIVKDYLV